MAIERTITNCSIEQFSKLLVTEKEYFKLWKQAIKEKRTKKEKVSASILYMQEGILTENVLAENLKKKGMAKPFYIIKKSDSLIHAFIGRKEPAIDRFGGIDNIIWGRYDGIHVFASQKCDDILIKFVTSLEYYKLRNLIFIILCLFIMIIPGLIVIAMDISGYKDDNTNISSIIYPAILESLGQPEAKTVMQ